MGRQSLDSQQTATLIAGCVEGNDGAKAQFYDEYHGLIRRAVERKIGQLHLSGRATLESADICQEIFERLFAEDCLVLRRIKQPRSIDAWLMTVARNHVITCLRKRSVRDQTVVSAAREQPEQYSASPEDRAVDEELRTRLQEKLATLPRHDRLVLELYFVQNLKYAEIADVIGLNINTVSAKLRRAKAKLRKLLEEES